MSKKRLHELKELLRYYDSLYYGRNVSVISDYEYDALKHEYKSLGGEDFVGNGCVDFDSELRLSNGADALGEKKAASQSSEYSKNKFQRNKVDHVASVLSIDNIYSFEELQQFVKKVSKSIESKLQFTHESKVLKQNKLNCNSVSNEKTECIESLEKKSASYDSDIYRSDFYPFFVQEKIDGLTLVLKYESGKLVSAATRGDGNVGDSVNVQHVFGVVNELVSEFIDKELLKNKVIEIRGEVFMKRSDFLSLNESLSKSFNASPEELVIESLDQNRKMYEGSKTEKKFSTPRHAASGSLKNLDMNLVHNRKLYFVAHGVALNDDFLNLMHESIHSLRHEVHGCLSEAIATDSINDSHNNSIHNSDKNFARNSSSTHNLTFDCIMNLLSSWKFSTIEGHVCNSLNEMQSAYENILSSRSSIDYDIDGVVYKLNDIMLQEKVGYSNSSPRFAIAYKFPPSAVQSVVKNISFSVGRTGLVTPVAHVKRVYLDGVYISNVSLHNFSELTRKGIEIGDVVTIERAGDVIPYIREVVKKKNVQKSEVNGSILNGTMPITSDDILPDFCPSCGAVLVQKGILYYCLNNKCCDQVILRLLYFADVLGIMGLGRKNIEFFYEKNFIREFIDIFNLNSYKQEMELSDNWGVISVDKLLNEIDKARNVRFDIFLKSLGIPGVGDFVSKSIAKHFNTLQNLLNAFNVRENKNVDGSFTANVNAAPAPDVKPELNDVAYTDSEKYELNADEKVNELNDLISLKEFLALCKKIYGVGEKTVVELYNYFERYLNTIVSLSRVMNVLPYFSSSFNARNTYGDFGAGAVDNVDLLGNNTIGNDVVEDNVMDISKISELVSSNVLSKKNAFSKELYQKEIVLTGRFIDVSRKELERIIAANDGLVKKEVSKKTYLVVFGENPTQRKIKAAEDDKVSVMYVTEFLNLLNEG